MNFPPIKAFPTNWENGMKLAAGHFQHLEDSIHDSLQDGRALAAAAGGSFGLLPYSPFQITTAEGATPGTSRLILQACRAVLPGGTRVEILPENIQQKQLPAVPPSVDFSWLPGILYGVFLTVEEKQRVPAGPPQIRPIRHPYLVPDYQLEVIARDKLPGSTTLAPNRMKIGEWKDGKRREGFIPPTFSLRGFELLERWFAHFEIKLEDIAKVCEVIIHSYRGKEPARVALVTPIMLLIRSTQGQFRSLLPLQTPVALVAYFENLAGLVYSLLVTLDKDFVRNQLRDGQVNDLLPRLNRLQNRKESPHEEMALRINLIKRFLDSLYDTLDGLQTAAPVQPKSGDQYRISSG